jgi:Tfp pilus assembly protein PilF
MAALLGGIPLTGAAVPDPCAGAETAVGAAIEALDRGRWADAERLLEPALAGHPECARVLVVQGRLLGRRGEPLAARQALEKAAALDPDDAEPRYHLGIWFFRARVFPEAARHFEKAAALRPKDARAWDYLALALEALGQPERAEEAYRSGLKVNEGAFFDVLLDYNYGRFLLKQDRLEQSGAHLDRAVALLPRRRGPHYERGKLNLARQDHAAARADGERALSLPDPAGLVLDVQVYYLLATVYARLGETALARKYAELARTTPIPDQAGDSR